MKTTVIEVRDENGAIVSTATNGDEFVEKAYMPFQRMARKKQNATMVMVMYEDGQQVRATMMKRYRRRAE